MTNYPNWFAATAQENFATYLEEFKGKPNLRFLQLGVFTGDATVWLCNNILTDESSKLIDVDTWEGSDEESHAEMDFSDVFQTYKDKVKDLPVVSVVSDTTKYLIRQMDNYIESYDFIYIDADHTTANVLMDAMLSWPLLKPGGIMAFDDYTWGRNLPPSQTPRPGILLFTERNKDKIETLVINSQYWIKKKVK
jgi:predicted O-methyltransferase YrrM